MNKSRWVGLAAGLIGIVAILGLVLWQGVSSGSVNTAFAQAAPTATPSAQTPTQPGSLPGGPAPANLSTYVNAFWSALAKQFGISVDDTKTKVTAAEKDVIEQMVTDGKLTRAQADQMEQGLSANSPFVPFLRGPGGRPGPGAAGGFRGGDLNNTATLEAVAMVLNLKPADLASQLQSGKTLADIATAQKVDQTQVKQAIVDANKAQIQKEVTDGLLTQAQADQMTSRLTVDQIDLTQIRGFGGRPGPGAAGGFRGGDLNNTATLEAVAAVLNLKPADLASQLQSGKTLADIATAQKVDQTQVKQAIVDANKAQIQKEVTDGLLTQAQADQMTSRLTVDQIDLTQIRGFGGRGFGPHGGPNTP